MATLTRGQTLGSTETVTNTKLHNLVDLGGVSNIVDADCSPSMNLADTKLADITTGNKVRGSALGNLASIPFSAGLIPIANIPVTLASIPNTSLLPITLTSWVDGSAMRNIQSMPSLAGQLAWYSISGSLASGSSPMYNGVDKFVGGVPGNFKLISKTTVSAATSSSNISITSGKFYLVKVDISLNSVASALSLQFNADSSSVYRYAFRELKDDGTTASGNSTSTTAINLGGVYDVTAQDYRANYEFRISPQGTTSGKYLHIQGNAWGNYSGSACKSTDFFGAWVNGATATSFVLSSNTFTGTIYLYEITQS